MARVTSVLVTAVALVVTTLVVHAPAGAVSTWRVEPENPVVSWTDPFEGSTTHTSEVEVSGVVHDRTELELTVQGTPDADGRPPWSMLVVAPLAWFSRPRSAPFNQDSDPSSIYFNLVGDMYGCNGQRGRIDVHDIALDRRHRVTRMRFDFAAECDGARMHGQVAWGYAGMPVLPGHYTWPAVDVGDWGRAVYFQMPNAPAWSGATTRIEGRDREDFEVVEALACHSGSAGSFCRVPVNFAPRAAGHRRATLVLETPERAARVPLEGVGNPGTVRLSVEVVRSDGVAYDDVLTHQNASLRITARPTGTDYVHAVAYDDEGGGFDITLDAARGERFVVGRTYVDPGGYDPGGVDIDVADARPGEAWISCGNNDSRGSFTFRQLHRAAGEPPAYALDFTAQCSRSYEGTLLFGARDDVTDPARAGRLRTDGSELLRWEPPSDAVRTVVRVRRGGLGAPGPDDGELLYSGPGDRVRIPGTYAGRAASYSVFTLDATGNISSARTLVVRGRTDLSTSTPVVTGERVVVTGTVTDAGWGYRLPGRRVALQARRSDGAWHTLQRGRVDDRGGYRFVQDMAGTRDLRVTAPGTATHRPATGPVRRVRVG